MRSLLQLEWLYFFCFVFLIVETDSSSKKYKAAERTQWKKANSMVRRLRAELSNRLLKYVQGIYC